MTVLGRELVRQVRLKLQAQDTMAAATAAIAGIEEQLRRMTSGQLLGASGAARLPLPEPGEGTRTIRQDATLLGLQDDPLSQEWRGGGAW